MSATICEYSVRVTLDPCDQPATHVVEYGWRNCHTHVCQVHLADATKPVVHYPEQYTVRPL